MNHKKMFWIFVMFLVFSTSLQAKMMVVTTTTDLQSIAQAVGGKYVTVVSLSKGYQDVHYVTPSLKLMSITNKADVFIEIGMDFELWTDRVIDGARNSQIRKGAKGHIVASRGVSPLDLPKNLTRAEGDLHPYGNPHIWLDPLNAKKIAFNISNGFQKVSPEHKDYFVEQTKKFQHKISVAMYGKKLVGLFGEKLLDRMTRKRVLISFLKNKKLSSRLQNKLGVVSLIELLGGWMKDSLLFRGKKIIFYHKQWIYFAHRFGLIISGYVEEKPGISPSVKHKNELIQQIKREKIQIMVVANFYSVAIPKAISKVTGIHLLVLPMQTKGTREVKDYFSLIDHLIQSIQKKYSQK